MSDLPISLNFFSLALWVTMITAGQAALAEEDVLSEVTVRTQRITSINPAASYASLATGLRFDAAIDLQSRGIPEGQGDLTVRGGLFENTGIKIGAINLFDPQTGHYVADVPIPPEFLSLPKVRTGIDNTVTGFNSNVATLEYALTEIQQGGLVSLGIGSDNLRYQTLTVAGVLNGRQSEQSTAEGTLSGALSYASSEGDGSLPNGDHVFERVAARLQIKGVNSRSDALFAYQDKFYGWPGAYTGFASFAETDHTKSTLILLNHRQVQSDSSSWQVGVFYRELEDDYDFDRFNKTSGVPGAFEHKTRAYAIAAQGLWRYRSLNWRFAAQLSADELVRSTDLTEGNFSERRYGSVSLLPSKRYDLSDGSQLELRFGLSLDTSNRDSSALSPLIGAIYEIPTADGAVRYRLEYAASSQLPGYTALNSRPTGLFGGNAGLGRERAKTIELGIEKESSDWLARATLFARRDDDLVDWTYLSGAPFARQANAVDVDVAGVELYFARHWQQADIAFGYSYLQKDSDYGAAMVDASFYALNYARHRLTISARYRPSEQVEVRLDNELREQYDNPLRSGSNKDFNASLSIGWRPIFARRLVLSLTGDNLSNSDYQQFPGTPAPGRHISLSGRYEW